MATTYAAAAERGMSVGGVLSRGFGVIGAAPAVMLATAFALVALPSALIGTIYRGMMGSFAAAAQGGPAANPLAGIWPALLGGGAIWWLLYLAAQAVLIRVAVAVLDRRPEPIGAHVAGAARTLPALFGLSIILSLAVWFGTLLLIVPGIMLAMMWSVAAPALVVERIGVFASMGRSRRLTKGARWRVFGTVMVVIVMYYLAAGAVGIGNIAAGGLAGMRAIGASPPLWSTILSIALSTGFVAAWSSVQAAMYVELRDAADGPAGARLADIFA